MPQAGSAVHSGRENAQLEADSGPAFAIIVLNGDRKTASPDPMHKKTGLPMS